ncbi:hypothetical protein [Streptomyces sp. SA15]|uniref:hypothetical protein n=1 Tax=Streptomyces sp. SA15 TaxID=934019 RepID=UPI00117F795E|nr:hypothetical protein [Streptomyces sp. SA15]
MTGEHPHPRPPGQPCGQGGRREAATGGGDLVTGADRQGVVEAEPAGTAAQFATEVANFLAA